MGHILYYFWDIFLYSIQPISTWMTKFLAWVQEKSVQRPYISPYLNNYDIWHREWFWEQHPSSKPFNGILLWIWCLNTCKWAQNTYFWKFHENCVFLNIDILGQNWAQGRFSRSFSFAIFKCTSVKINPSLTSSRNLSILSHSLSTMLIRTFNWMPPLNYT